MGPCKDKTTKYIQQSRQTKEDIYWEITNNTTDNSVHSTRKLFQTKQNYFTTNEAIIGHPIYKAELNNLINSIE